MGLTGGLQREEKRAESREKRYWGSSRGQSDLHWMKMSAGLTRGLQDLEPMDFAHSRVQPLWLCYTTLTAEGTLR
jgi:hypothetical protein